MDRRGGRGRKGIRGGGGRRTDRRGGRGRRGIRGGGGRRRGIRGVVVMGEGEGHKGRVREEEGHKGPVRRCSSLANCASFCNHSTCRTSRAAYQMESRGVSLYTVFLHVALQTAIGITGRNNTTDTVMMSSHSRSIGVSTPEIILVRVTQDTPEVQCTCTSECTGHTNSQASCTAGPLKVRRHTSS